MTYIKCPEFTVKDPKGNLIALKCKVCGTVIARMEDRLVNTTMDKRGNKVQTQVSMWTRTPLYTELMMAFKGGGSHATHGCSKCIHPGLSVEQLDMLQNADIEEQRPEMGDRTADILKARVPTGIVALKRGGEGVG